MSCCDCKCNPIDSWDKRTDVPQYGTSFLQLPATEFYKDAKLNQLINIRVMVRYVGTPPNMFGGGVYKIEQAFGFEELIGKMYGFGYSNVNEIKEQDEQQIS